ncbi:hypothetical protein L596_007740 [Steinernema carpocapsae]|uniref:RRM domain-containing protein n=1 Tax=Steinernema carpocapsae TaxID=34508 RepID=A0A4U5PAF7_STECR|nr:hypothetical protein L596_007740 [Steinernema carpocapsae]
MSFNSFESPSQGIPDDSLDYEPDVTMKSEPMDLDATMGPLKPEGAKVEPLDLNFDEAALEKRMQELNEEVAQLAGLKNKVFEMAENFPSSSSSEERKEVDLRSIYVGNVDYQSRPEELKEFFEECGMVERVTILANKYTGHPKGYAYVEFSNEEAMTKALAMDGMAFRNRELILKPKRTNEPGISSTNYLPRGFFRPAVRSGFITKRHHHAGFNGHHHHHHHSRFRHHIGYRHRGGFRQQHGNSHRHNYHRLNDKDHLGHGFFAPTKPAEP